jgi:hypothetical protein
MTNAVIVLNAGSSSLKFGAHGIDATKTLPLLARGQIVSMRGPHLGQEWQAFGRSRLGRGPGDRSRDSLAVRDPMIGSQDGRHQDSGGTR